MSDTAGINLPFQFTERMKLQLGADLDPFMLSFLEETPVAVRINPAKWKTDIRTPKVPWCSHGYYLEKRPAFTADPWFHGGAYYVQEPHSMFLEQAYLAAQLPGKALVLDLCGAPGGKTTHLQSLLRPQDLLVTNEVIRGRAGILRENVQKWGFPNVVITQNDPKDFGKMTGIFDMILVDAPCSGEGLFRKDRHSAGEWSLRNAEMCSSRQKRILAEAWKCLRPGGYLIYSTCTYNPSENENNLRWLQEQEEAEPVEIPLNRDWKIRESREGNITGYQFFPHLTKGEGFFLGMVRKKDERLKDERLKDKRLKDERFKDFRGVGNGKVMEEWISRDFDSVLHFKEGIFYAFPSSWMNYLPLLEKNLNILQAGTPVGSGNERQLHPHPALALSLIYNRSAFPEINLDLADAIRYLRKENLLSTGKESGWTLAKFRDVPLGWLKNLGNRTNNYFPGEWRIRMNIGGLPDLFYSNG